MTEMNILQIPVVLTSGEELSIPYWRIDSGVKGPVFLAIACQHGNEINGCISIHRFIERIKTSLKKGMVIGVPFANLLALKARRPHLDLGPEQPYIESQGHNMQMLWPGNANGNDTERLAFAIWNNIVTKATHIVDIHCYPKSAAPLIQIHRTGETEKIARIMGFPFLRYIPDEHGHDWPGSIRLQAGKLGKVVIGCELSGQYGLWENGISLGERALLYVVNYLGMIDDKHGEEPPPILLDLNKYLEVKAEHSGLFVQSNFSLCDSIKKGDSLGYILGDKNLDVCTISAPVNGHIIRVCSRPDCDVSLKDCHQFVYEGDVLAVIAPIQ